MSRSSHPARRGRPSGLTSPNWAARCGSSSPTAPTRARRPLPDAAPSTTTAREAERWLWSIRADGPSSDGSPSTQSSIRSASATVVHAAIAVHASSPSRAKMALNRSAMSAVGPSSRSPDGSSAMPEHTAHLEQLHLALPAFGVVDHRLHQPAGHRRTQEALRFDQRVGDLDIRAGRSPNSSDRTRSRRSTSTPRGTRARTGRPSPASGRAGRGSGGPAAATTGSAGRSVSTRGSGPPPRRCRPRRPAPA